MVAVELGIVFVSLRRLVLYYTKRRLRLEVKTVFHISMILLTLAHLQWDAWCDDHYNAYDCQTDDDIILKPTMFSYATFRFFTPLMQVCLCCTVLLWCDFFYVYSDLPSGACLGELWPSFQTMNYETRRRARLVRAILYGFIFVDMAINLAVTLPIYFIPDQYSDGSDDPNWGTLLIEWYNDIKSFGCSAITLVAGIHMRNRLRLTGAIESTAKEALINRFNRRIAIIVTCNLLNILSTLALFSYFGTSVAEWLNTYGLVVFFIFNDVLPFDVVSIVLLVIMRKPPQVSRVDYTLDYTFLPALPSPTERGAEALGDSAGHSSDDDVAEQGEDVGQKVLLNPATAK